MRRGLGLGLALCALIAHAQPVAVGEDPQRFVYLWMPEDERASVSRPLLCFALSQVSVGPAPSSDCGSPTCARFGDLCDAKTSPGPYGLDLFPPGSRVEAWWQHTGETWPVLRRGRIITATVAFSSLHQAHTGRVHGYLDLALDPEIDDEGADARKLHRVKIGPGVCPRCSTLFPLLPCLLPELCALQETEGLTRTPGTGGRHHTCGAVRAAGALLGL